jgi:bifunctional non-homologous end joining protein LigD
VKLLPVLQINNRQVNLSNLDKVFWPETGLTKHDLLQFYIDISPYLLPYLRDRPCSFQRLPDGIGGKQFYQKNVPSFAPSWIQTFPVSRGKKTINYILVNNLETLVYLVNLACMVFHPWHSRIHSLNFPDWGVIDLDPQPGVPFSAVLETAAYVKEILDEQGLNGNPKTSGATGLQIFLPLKPRYTYEQVKGMFEYLCLQVHRRAPRLTTMERTVKKRGLAVYLDYLQNLQGQTINAPYTVRPVPQAQVSTPVTWEEVLSQSFTPQSFTMLNIRQRLKKKGDIFLPVIKEGQLMPRLLQKAAKRKGQA